MSTAVPGFADPDGDRDAGTTLRILVVEADDRTRESVVGILGIRHRFDVVGSAAHVAEALDVARRTHPDIVILDPRLPDVSDGMSLVRRLRAIDAGLAILVVGWSPDLEPQALAAGADGFVRKTFKPGDLAAAVARCMDRRVIEAASDIADASAPIRSLAGKAAPGAQPEADDAGQQRPRTPANRSSRGPVAPRGTGLIL